MKKIIKIVKEYFTKTENSEMSMEEPKLATGCLPTAATYAATNTPTISNAYSRTYGAPIGLRQSSSVSYVSALSSTAAWTPGNAQNTQFTFAAHRQNAIDIYGINNKMIVSLLNDGTVVWGDEIQIDEAAEAFGKSFKFGGEIAAGITQGVKCRMRDSVFEELINIAKEKGLLTVDDLTYLHQAAKIIDKLSGARE